MPSASLPRSEEQQRRAAEREGRRIRRMRMRELKAISKHADGMSSDEEVPETEASAFRTQIGIYCILNFWKECQISMDCISIESY